MKATKISNGKQAEIEINDVLEWHNGPISFTEKVLADQNGKLAVRGVMGNLIPLEVLCRNFAGNIFILD